MPATSLLHFASYLFHGCCPPCTLPPPGSSRELAGFSVEPHTPTIAAILRRTALFLPSLAHLLLPCHREGAGEQHMGQVVQQAEDEAIGARVNVVRTGLRPYGGFCSLLAIVFCYPNHWCVIPLRHPTLPPGIRHPHPTHAGTLLHAAISYSHPPVCLQHRMGGLSLVLWTRFQAFSSHWAMR
ncbi:unnamed protein product, partial [Closterium sp. NIES-54]